MANPNIVSVASIYGETAYLIPAATTSKILLPNTSTSGKVYKINQIVAANVDGSSAVNVTVDLYTMVMKLQVLHLQMEQRMQLFPLFQSRRMPR